MFCLTFNSVLTTRVGGKLAYLLHFEWDSIGIWIFEWNNMPHLDFEMFPIVRKIVPNAYLASWVWPAWVDSFTFSRFGLYMFLYMIICVYIL